MEVAQAAPSRDGDQDLVELVSRFILIGPPGSGKGTQGQVLAQALHVPHIASGDLIREIVEGGSERGLRFKAQIDGGNFISDEDVVAIIEDRLEQPDSIRGYVLDGFPRKVTQAELFAKTAPGLQLDRAISLVLPVDDLVERLSGRLTCLACGASYHVKYRPPAKDDICDECGHDLVKRADDEPDSIRQRLKVYHAKTEPLIDYYRNLNKLIELDATGAADAVFARLIVELKFDVAKKGIR